MSQVRLLTNAANDGADRRATTGPIAIRVFCVFIRLGLCVSVVMLALASYGCFADDVTVCLRCSMGNRVYVSFQGGGIVCGLLVNYPYYLFPPARDDENMRGMARLTPFMIRRLENDERSRVSVLRLDSAVGVLRLADCGMCQYVIAIRAALLIPLIGMAGVILLGVLRRAGLTQQQYLTRGYCGSCGYCLFENVWGICPECGIGIKV